MDGEKSIDGCQFYLCLVQCIIYIFFICIVLGILYEVDIRLCFFGVFGLFVSLIDVFDEYQC